MRLTAQKLGHTGAHVPANASESAFPGRVPGLPASEPAATEPAAPGAKPPKATTEDEAKLQKALAKIDEDEKKQKERAERLGRMKAESEKLKDTPEYKCKQWIETIEAREKSLKDEIEKMSKEDSPVPEGIGREYIASFRKDLSALKRQKSALEKAQKAVNDKTPETESEGKAKQAEYEQLVKSLAQVEPVSDKVKKSLRTFKAMYKRYAKDITDADDDA